MNNKNLEELKKRDLDKCYFCLYCISLDVFMHLGNHKVDKEKIYLFYGCNLLGKRRYLSSISSSNCSSTSNWYNFFQEIKNRGVEQIIYATILDNKSMNDALKLSFPNIEIIISTFDPIFKISNYFSSGYSSSLLTHIKNIFLADNLQEYQLFLDAFKEEFNVPFALDIIHSNLVKAKDYYSLPLHIRKAIFAYYFLRDNIKRLTVISHSKQHFDSLDDFISSCIPVFQTLELKTYCSKKEWIAILNTLYDSKKDLIKSYL